ncbi:Hint domain-containing protein [Mesobacterium pallidum]|uniref:Hint domain-containing protein n=1 Tax=Mesobacterium pallidum TaxID=2872037 RepID=UPI001EE38F6F|nr:Hint domain-containing protein [Mesobacterium pallidum]
MNTSDYMTVVDAPYHGYTVEIDGIDFAIFFKSGFAYIPYSTTYPLQPSDFPGTSISVTAEAQASVANCFMADTMIATPRGEVAVQDLQPGDEITLTDGSAAPVRWVARQALMPVFGLPERNRIVEVAPGALGDGVPHSTLRLTSDHALLLDGVLVHAGALINGDTIRMLPDHELPERFTVYHVETESHAVLLSNGAPSETFIDNVPRSAFDNHDEYLAMYGKDQPLTEADYPRAMSARQVPMALRARLNRDIRASA